MRDIQTEAQLRVDVKRFIHKTLFQECKKRDASYSVASAALAFRKVEILLDELDRPKLDPSGRIQFYNGDNLPLGVVFEKAIKYLIKLEKSQEVKALIHASYAISDQLIREYDSTI